MKRKTVYIGVNDAQGNAQILRHPISDQELADYMAHPVFWQGGAGIQENREPLRSI